MIRVDNFLSRKAAAMWPCAVVLEDGAEFLLARPDMDNLILANENTPPKKRFRVAREALGQLIAHEQAQSDG